MGQITELRLPADRSHVIVAKRAASALASVAGFDVEAVADLTIAVAQACENAIQCLERTGALAGQVRMTFRLEDKSLEVTVRSAISRDAELAARARVAEGMREREAQRAGRRELTLQDAASTDLALRLMGLFVDDHSYRLDERTGGLRVRLTKYRAS